MVVRRINRIFGKKPAYNNQVFVACAARTMVCLWLFPQLSVEYNRNRIFSGLALCHVSYQCKKRRPCVYGYGRTIHQGDIPQRRKGCKQQFQRNVKFFKINLHIINKYITFGAYLNWIEKYGYDNYRRQ